jgi:hypothetical protein
VQGTEIRFILTRISSSLSPEVVSSKQVLDSALVVFVALISRDGRDIVDLADRTNAVPILFRILGSLKRKSDTLGLVNSGLTDIELKNMGIARTEKALVRV